MFLPRNFWAFGLWTLRFLLFLPFEEFECSFPAVLFLHRLFEIRFTFRKQVPQRLSGGKTLFRHDDWTPAGPREKKPEHRCTQEWVYRWLHQKSTLEELTRSAVFTCALWSIVRHQPKLLASHVSRHDVYRQFYGLWNSHSLIQWEI